MRNLHRIISCAVLSLILILQCIVGSSAEEQSSNKTLTIYGAFSRSLMQAYQQAHPDVSVEYMSFQDAQQIISNAVAHDTKPDIYCFSSLESPFYPSLRNRGFLAEITVLSAHSLVDSTYAGIQDECYDADHVLRAIPFAVVPSNRLAVNAALWQSLSLGALPQTWNQMFDFLEKWCSSPEVYNAYSLMGYGSAEETRNMIGYVLRADYDSYRRSFETPPKYSTEEYRQLLHRLQAIPLENLDYNIATEETLMSDMYLPSPADGLFSDSSLDCLQLAIAEDIPVATQAVIHFVCVNLASPNQALAMDFIDFCAQNLKPETLATICPNYDIQVASDGFEQKQAEYSAQSELLLAQLAAAEAAEDTAQKEAVLLEINRLDQEYNEYLQSSAYFINENSLDRYHEIVKGGLLVNYGEGVLDPDVLNDLSEKHRLFIAGQLSVEQYTEVLDRIVYMQEQEWK